MVAVRCKGEVQYLAPKDTQDPLVIFDLDSLGINQTRFLSDLRASFDQLEWDFYDVRREQLVILQKSLKQDETLNQKFKLYYSGELTLQDLLNQLPAVPSEVIEKMMLIKPYRRRATSRFELQVKNKSSDVWDVTRSSNQQLVQKVESSDYRSMPRSFKETAIEVVDHPEFQRLVQAIGVLVKNSDPSVQHLTLTCWQTGIVARPERVGSNSPEGIHQDGADYIVSALVTERDNIQGGISRVFAADKCTEFLEVTLKPGQGIFQADAGSALWHDVTPIQVQNPKQGQGIRNLFGFDVQVNRRK